MAGSNLVALQLPDGRRHHAFLSHTWLPDEAGRDTHARAATLNKLLQSRGLVTWFDQDKMQVSPCFFLSHSRIEKKERVTMTDDQYSLWCIFHVCTISNRTSTNS